jgi:gas vesicle protein
MNEWILFTIGIFIGGMVGFMTIALLTAGKTEDLYNEIQDLRIQRKLLKEELLKKKFSKPKPRKYRKKNRNVKPK